MIWAFLGGVVVGWLSLLASALVGLARNRATYEAGLHVQPQLDPKFKRRRP